MMRQEVSGTVYTVDVKVERRRKSCASASDFSTFDMQADRYTWEEYGAVRYLVQPTGQKGNVMSMTMYVQADRQTYRAHLPKLVGKILKSEFLSRVCGARVLHVGKPKLFLRPLATQQHADIEPEIASERIADMIFHA